MKLADFKPSALFNRAVAPAMKSITTFAQVAATAIYVKTANIWRDQYNPLRALTMARAVSLLEAGERGAYADLQWTYRFIEKRDAVLRGGKRSLLSAIEEMDWTIKQVPEKELPKGFTKAQAEAQAIRLRQAYEGIDNMTAATGHLALAEFRGFAHLEKHYAQGGKNDGAIVHLEPVPQWYMCRDGLNGHWNYNADAASGRTKGVPIDLANFIIREIDDPINEIALIAFVRKNLSQKDWDGFIESFGIPSIFAIMPQNVPAGQEAEYQNLAEGVISNSRGALPHGSDIKSVDVGQRGGIPFKEHKESQNEEIVMAITSGMLTILAESGSGTLAGGAHTDTFKRIARALAQRISETFQCSIDKPILESEFEGQPCLAYFELAANEEQDTGEYIKGVAELSGAGFQADPGQVSEKTGIQVTLKPEPQTAPGPKDSLAFNRLRTLTNRSNQNPKSASAVDSKFLAQARLDVGTSTFNDTRSVFEELGQLLATVSDEELPQALKDFNAALPEKLSGINADPSSVEVFKKYMGTALAGGLSKEEPK